MALTPPALRSMLSMPITSNNFIAMQSAKVSVGTGNQTVTFTNIPSTQRVTFKLSNTGGTAAYIAGGNGSATAVLSTSTPQPTSGSATVSNCDCIPAGAILTQDYVGGTNTLAFISAGTTVIEISVGGGQ